jgi:MraZ protein
LTFRGTFEHALDAKHRLTVPSKFRAALADGVVLAKAVQTNPSAPRCIRVWTADAFDAYTEKALGDKDPFSVEANEMEQFLFSGSHDTELDSAYRVMLTPQLMAYAGLTKEVVITGAGKCLEVWDRAAYAAYSEDIASRIPDIAKSLATHTA